MLDTNLSDIPLDVLAARMLATAFVVMAVSWAVGAFGPTVGGALAGLPVILGPGLYFLAAQASTPFVAQAASYALLSLSATQFFLLTYIVMAGREPPWICLACAMSAWLLAVLMIRLLPAHAMTGILVFILATGLCWHIGRSFVLPETKTGGRAGICLSAVRGLLAGTLVAVVTGASYQLGSTAAGLLLAFPIGYTVVAVTVHQKMGAASAAATLHSALLGTASLAGFCTVLAYAIEHLTTHAAFGISVLTSMAITATVIFKKQAFDDATSSRENQATQGRRRY